MEEIFATLRSIKKILPPEKRFRAMIENDGRSPIIFIDNRTFVYDNDHPKLPLTQDEINRIGEIPVVRNITYKREKIIVSIEWFPQNKRPIFYKLVSLHIKIFYSMFLTASACSFVKEPVLTIAFKTCWRLCSAKSGLLFKP